jgi:hypothetical protein
MFKSLRIRIVLILTLLILSVMAVVGTFLINSVSDFYHQDFQKQMTRFFTRRFWLTWPNRPRANTPTAFSKTSWGPTPGSSASVRTGIFSFWTERTGPFSPARTTSWTASWSGPRT